MKGTCAKNSLKEQQQIVQAKCTSLLCGIWKHDFSHTICVGAEFDFLGIFSRRRYESTQTFNQTLPLGEGCEYVLRQ